MLLSFDVDNETIPIRNGQPTIGGLSQGQYGARRALPRIIEILDEHDIPASFFIPAMSLRFNPEMLDAIQAAGHHEIGIHGWIHETNSLLEGDEERALLERAVAYLTEVTGERPVGYRAPSWNFSPNTLDIILDMDFLYDSSLMADDRPYEIVANGEPTGLIELPVEWILDDAPLLNPRGNSYSAPRDVLQVYIDEFDRAWEEGTMLVLTMHPHYIGHRSRILILEGLIEHINARGNVWYATHRAVAEYVQDFADQTQDCTFLCLAKGEEPVLLRALGVAGDPPDHAAHGPLAGQLMETVVLGEILKTLTHRGVSPQVYFWRTSSGVEVDFLVEAGSRLVPVEVRKTAMPRPGMARTLRRLQGDLGSRVAPGYLVHEAGEAGCPWVPA